MLTGYERMNERILFIFWGDFPTDHQLLPLFWSLSAMLVGKKNLPAPEYSCVEKFQVHRVDTLE
jgi:hypothetical protein